MYLHHLEQVSVKAKVVVMDKCTVLNCFPLVRTGQHQPNWTGGWKYEVSNRLFGEHCLYQTSECGVRDGNTVLFNLKSYITFTPNPLPQVS